MHLSHKNWTITDHQLEVRNEYMKIYQDESGISTQSNWVLFFSSRKQLTVALNPR